MDDFKMRYSIQDVAKILQLPETKIIHFIEDGFFPIYAKSIVLTILLTKDEDDVLETIFLRTDKETEKKYFEIVDNYNLKHTSHSFPFTKPAKITLGEDFLLEADDIAKAAVDNFSLCFTYKEHIDALGKELGIANLPSEPKVESVGGDRTGYQAANESVSTNDIQANSNEVELSGLLNVPAKKDGWFQVIDDMTRDFYRQHNKIPNEPQAWGRLWENPPVGYEITTNKDKGKEDCLTMPGASPLSQSAFSKRWKKYMPINPNNADNRF
jgi:hypothetical protein